MVDVRRAYGRWLKRRLLWLAPSFLLSCAICLMLAADPRLPSWIRIPSLALSAGVVILFGALVAHTILVIWEKSRGKTRRAQVLRAELRPYPAIGLASLLLLLILLAVPFIFREPPPVPVPQVHRPKSHAVEPAPPAISPTPVVAAAPVVLPVEPEKAAPTPVPSPIPPDKPVGVPQILPEIARLPELPFLWEEWQPPTPTPEQEEGTAGIDRFGMKHRPGPDDHGFLEAGIHRKIFDREGVPSEGDLESWIPPELQVEVMFVARSGLWRGAAFQTAFDWSFGRNDSIRLTYAVMMLSDDQAFDGVEPSLSWNRGMVEYVRRIAGYTRQSSFDLAIRIGVSADWIGTHEASVRFDRSVRLSPWFGFESAVWEDDGVGLVVQASHSLATRLTDGSSSVTDLRVLVRINLGEQSSLELGYRITSVHFRDRGGAKNEYQDMMDQSFSGPIAGLTLRF